MGPAAVVVHGSRPVLFRLMLGSDQLHWGRLEESWSDWTNLDCFRSAAGDASGVVLACCRVCQLTPVKCILSEIFIGYYYCFGKVPKRDLDRGHCYRGKGRRGEGK